MKRYRVTAEEHTTIRRFIDVDAESLTDARDKATALDDSDWTEDISSDDVDWAADVVSVEELSDEWEEVIE